MKSLIFTSFIALLLLAPQTSFADPTYQFPANDGPLNHNAVMEVYDSDNGLENANETGKGNVSTGAIHGDYSNNTNACASCHRTHTASSESLLFEGNKTDTCLACHDGTLGYYNLFQPSAAGIFSTDQDDNISHHMSNQSLTTSAAPGGMDPSHFENVSGDVYGPWETVFDCGSCHAPHGSYSDRLLAYNPNGMANITPEYGGQKVVGEVYELSDPASWPAPGANAPKYITLRGTKNQWASTGLSVNSDIYANSSIQPADLAIAIYVLAKNESEGYAYSRSNLPWLDDRIIDIEFGAIEASHFIGIIDGKSTIIDEKTSGVTFGWVTGFAYGPATGPLSKVIEANIPQCYSVRWGDDAMTLFQEVEGITPYTINDRALFDDKYAAYNKGQGIRLSSWCGACHTDYLANSSDNSGTFKKANHHVTATDSLTCIRCHFAHGTDSTVMRDASGRTVAQLVYGDSDTSARVNIAQSVTYAIRGSQVLSGNTITPDPAFAGELPFAKAYMRDKNNSSALKKYTNMSVCWGCHTDQKSASLINNAEFMDKQNKPAGLTYLNNNLFN